MLRRRFPGFALGIPACAGHLQHHSTIHCPTPGGELKNVFELLTDSSFLMASERACLKHVSPTFAA
jgi:hypothetical protein